MNREQLPFFKKYYVRAYSLSLLPKVYNTTPCFFNEIPIIYKFFTIRFKKPSETNTCLSFIPIAKWTTQYTLLAM